MKLITLIIVVLKVKKISLIYRTLKDIGLKHFWLRIIYEIRKKIEEQIPQFFYKKFFIYKQKNIIFKKLDFRKKFII